MGVEKGARKCVRGGSRAVLLRILTLVVFVCFVLCVEGSIDARNQGCDWEVFWGWQGSLGVVGEMLAGRWGVAVCGVGRFR